MRRFSARVTAVVFLLAAGLGFTTLNCGQHGSAGDVGSLHLALSAGGFTINSVTYTITTQGATPTTVLIIRNPSSRSTKAML